MDIELYNKFVSDYNNLTLTTHDVRRINNLNSREYRVIRNLAIRNKDIPAKRHMNSTNAKYYCKTPRGTYTVQKQYGRDKIYAGEFPDKETAEMIRDKCIEVEWQLNKISDIIDEHKIKPKNYTLVNGYYVIQKAINGKNKIFCALKQDCTDEDTVKAVVGKFREHNWDIDCKDKILKEFELR